MSNRARAIPLLAIGLGWGGLSVPTGVEAAPATPPPPKARTLSPSSSRATPPPPTGDSPFLPTPRTRAAPRSGARSSAVPPPPATATPAPEAETARATREREPELPPKDLSNTWSRSTAKTAIRPRYVRTNDPALAAPNPVGFYSGVSMQGNHVPPFPAHKAGAPPAVMTWTGFERAAEGSRVFFQLSTAASFAVEQKGQTLRIRLRNTKVNVRNNMRRLDLRYFKTPVQTVKVNRRGRDTIATIVLKREAQPVVELVEGKAGYSLLVVQFADATATTTSVTPVAR